MQQSSTSPTRETVRNTVASQASAVRLGDAEMNDQAMAVKGTVRHAPCVLVVDDEAYIVDFLCMLLEEEGYDVLRAYDGQEALELVRLQHPDLVISDVMMPKMNGLELLDRLRASPDDASPAVILMSAVSRMADMTDVQFLAKPFDIDRMLEMVTAELAAD